jgi:hypothetical protein
MLKRTLVKLATAPLAACASVAFCSFPWPRSRESATPSGGTAGSNRLHSQPAIPAGLDLWQRLVEFSDCICIRWHVWRSTPEAPESAQLLVWHANRCLGTRYNHPLSEIDPKS